MPIQNATRAISPLKNANKKYLSQSLSRPITPSKLWEKKQKKRAMNTIFCVLVEHVFLGTACANSTRILAQFARLKTWIKKIGANLNIHRSTLQNFQKKPKKRAINTIFCVLVENMFLGTACANQRQFNPSTRQISPLKNTNKKIGTNLYIHPWILVQL